MYTIIKVPEFNRMAIELANINLINNCCNNRFIKKDIFYQCCNSIYIITDEEERKDFFGIIACRRIQSKNISEHELQKYHPQRHHAVYRIEALHYNKNVSLEQREELIETCLKDKNDSFVILECKCKEVLKDIELFKKLGFDKGYIDNEKTILVRPPKKPKKVILKSLFKKRKIR